MTLQIVRSVPVISMVARITAIALFTIAPTFAAETTLTDSTGQTAWLYTPTDAPDPAKTYWLAVGVHGAGGNGKDACGIASWAQGDVIVLGPSFVQPPRDPNEPKSLGMPADSYQMAGPTHVAKLKALVAEVGKSWKLHPGIFLHGFSAGAQFTHRFALREPSMTLGISAASGGSWANRDAGGINSAARGIPFAVSCGEYDRDKSWPDAPLSRVEWMKEFAVELDKAGFDVESRVIENCNHQQHEETFDLAKSCFARARGLHFSRTALLAFDFNDSDPLWGLTGTPAGEGVTVAAAWDPRGGMIEQAGSALPTGALRFEVNSGPSSPQWSGSMSSGLLPVRCPESDAKLLTLAFDLRASAVRTVEVMVESFGAAKQRTGGLTGIVHPAAPGFYHRHTLDVGAMTPAGDGTFSAADPFVRVTFRIGSDLGWPATAGHQVRVDNLGYAAPALYVSPAGNDKEDHGLSADRPLATVQQAVDRSQAGDVIMVMEGTYERKFSVAQIQAAGAPAAWRVLRAYPGHRPVFRSLAWDCIKIGQANSGTISEVPAPAYIELRGLTIHGRSAEVEAKYKEKIGKPEPETNGNGISLDGRFQKNKPHHIRIADCTVFECPGGGISAIHTDRVSIENNHTYENCHWMIYAGSGISVYQTFNFEDSPGEYRMLVRNNVSHDNYCTQPWVVTGKSSDGNGLIVDDLRNTQNKSPNGIYQGRVLVQGNLSYRNGGSGMHAFSSDRVDFIHNTAAGNNTREDYTQIGITRCTDCRIVNNIMVAPADKSVSRVNGNSHGITISHNLYWGGNGTPLPGDHWRSGDPRFAHAEAGDFRLAAGSPALGQGALWEIVPATFQNGTPRPHDRLPDLGTLPAAQ